MKKIYFIATCCLAMCLSAYSIDRGTEKGHEWVDLGLPSGTKWATCNVGAKNPQEYGNYYAWGEVTTKEDYTWDTYKYGSSKNGVSSDQLTKYNIESRYGKNGFADGKTVLELEDDAAHFNWGGKWRMPTRAQQDELREQCYWVRTESYNGSGVKGYIVYKAKSSSDKGKNMLMHTPSSSYTLSDAHIFLPAAGCHGYVGHYAAGFIGYYWSSLLNTDNPYGAWSLYFYFSYVSSNDAGYRYHGQPVRAVIPVE